MQPSIPDGSFILINAWAYRKTDPSAGEIVVFKIGNELHCKRIKTKIGDSYELAGDNPGDSYDSRDFGLVNKSSIIGRVMFR